MNVPTRGDVQARFLVLTGLRHAPVGLAVPVLVLIMTSRGLGLTTIGALVALQSGIVLCLEVPSGGLADSWGRRRVLLVAGTAHVVAMLLFATAHDPAGFAVAVALNGVFRALDSGPLEAWYVDAALDADTDADIETGLARAGVVTGVALAVGSAAAAALALLPAADGQVPGAVTLPLFAAAGVTALHVVAVALLMHDTHPHRRRPRVTRVGRTVAVAAGVVRHDRGIRLLLAAMASWAVAQVALELLWQPRLAQLVAADTADTAAGLTSVLMFAAAGAGAVAVPRLTRRLGAARAAVVARLVQGGAMLWLAAAGSPVMLGAALTLCLLGTGALSAIHAALLHRRVDAQARATVVSINSLTGQLGAVGGSLGMGALAASASIPTAWLVGGAVFLTGALLYRGVERACAPGRAVGSGHAPGEEDLRAPRRRERPDEPLRGRAASRP